MDIKFKFDVKKLEIEPEKTGFMGKLKSKQVQKTLIAILLGAIGGFLYFYIAEGRSMDTMPIKEILQSVAFGAFIGFFVTNSPCARNKC